MHNFTFKKFKNKKKFDDLRINYEDKISQDNLILIKSILYKLKKCILNEEIIVFGYLYGLYFLDIINIENQYISELDKKRINILEESFKYENNGDFKSFLETLFIMDNDLFRFKMRIKSTILNFGEKYMHLIPNKKNYLKAIGYSIPILTLKSSKVLSLFQDIYFENLYKEKFEKTKKFYQKRIKQMEFPGEHLNTIINDFSDIMFDLNIIGKTKIRRKSYFSLYNKIKRKKHQNIFDILGIMLIFKNMRELNMFINIFEQKFIYIEKKDYIKNPKKNGYKSIHYKFITMYRNKEIGVELQVKTQHIERQLEASDIKSHYNYTMNEKKWDSIFKEVTSGYKILNNYLKK